MIELGYAPDQQAKGRLAKFTFIVSLAAQFHSKHAFKLLIVQCCERDIVGQLVNSNGITILIDIPVDLHSIVLKIICRFQFDAFLHIEYRVGQIGVDGLFRL